MVIMFSVYGYYVFSLWLLCFQFMDIMFSVYGHHVFSLWLLCFQFMDIMFSVYGHHVFSLWLLCFQFMVILFQVYGHYVMRKTTDTSMFERPAIPGALVYYTQCRVCGTSAASSIYECVNLVKALITQKVILFRILNGEFGKFRYVQGPDKRPQGVFFFFFTDRMCVCKPCFYQSLHVLLH